MRPGTAVNRVFLCSRTSEAPGVQPADPGEQLDAFEGPGLRVERHSGPVEPEGVAAVALDLDEAVVEEPGLL